MMWGDQDLVLVGLEGLECVVRRAALGPRTRTAGLPARERLFVEWVKEAEPGYFGNQTVWASRDSRSIMRAAGGALRIGKICSDIVPR